MFLQILEWLIGEIPKDEANISNVEITQENIAEVGETTTFSAKISYRIKNVAEQKKYFISVLSSSKNESTTFNVDGFGIGRKRIYATLGEIKLD
jgi:hypothetical protein